MKNKKLLFILDILYFCLFFIFSFFFFNDFFSLDYALSSLGPLNDKLYLLEIRKIILLPFSFFFTCIIDFSFIDTILEKIKLKKYSKLIFSILFIITVGLFIGFWIFRNKYSLI